MAIYVPRVLLCGDAATFRKIIGDKPAEIVGQVICEWAGDEVQLFYGGQLLTGAELSRLLDDAAEYLIFTDPTELNDYLEPLKIKPQVISATTFAKKVRDGFFSYAALALLVDVLNRENFSGRVLDLDCFLAKSDFRTRLVLNVALDCVAENFGGALFPITKNLYGEIYATFDDCRYHVFDAVILTRERTPEEFIDAMIATDALSEKFLAFARRGSALESWLDASKNIFAKIETFSTNNGAWYLIQKYVPKDFCVYVVTHKNVKLDALPEGYRIIHAGHAQAAQDFGYAVDDIGDNISRLNPFLDEITALYWIWRNTKHTHTGIVHYRRLFTKHDAKTFDEAKSLSKAEILRLLDEYDIIVSNEYLSERNQLELMILSTGQPDLVRIAEEIVRKHLAATQPDYLDAYDAVINGFTLFICGVFVTRRNILDAYCEWLFSFMLGATLEMRDKVKVGDKRLEDLNHMHSRMMSYFAERMLTVWLTKNHLRIKTLPMMYRD